MAARSRLDGDGAELSWVFGFSRCRVSGSGRLVLHLGVPGFFAKLPFVERFGALGFGIGELLGGDANALEDLACSL